MNKIKFCPCCTLSNELNSESKINSIILSCGHTVAEYCSKYDIGDAIAQCPICQAYTDLKYTNLQKVFIPVDQVNLEEEISNRAEEKKSYIERLKQEIKEVKQQTLWDRNSREFFVENQETMLEDEYVCLEIVHCSTGRLTKKFTDTNLEAKDLIEWASKEFELDYKSCQMVLVDGHGTVFGFDHRKTLDEIFDHASIQRHQFHIELAEDMKHKIHVHIGFGYTHVRTPT